MRELLEPLCETSLQVAIAIKSDFSGIPFLSLVLFMIQNNKTVFHIYSHFSGLLEIKKFWICSLVFLALNVLEYSNF